MAIIELIRSVTVVKGPRTEKRSSCSTDVPLLVPRSPTEICRSQIMIHRAVNGKYDIHPHFRY